MKFSQEDKKKFVFILSIVLISLTFYFFLLNVASLWLGLRKLFKMSRTIILGFSLAFVLNIILNNVESLLVNRLRVKNKKFARSFSLFLSYLIFVFAILLIFLTVIPQFIDSLVSLISNLPSLLSDILIKAKEIDSLAPYAKNLEDYLLSLNISKLNEQVINFLVGKAGPAFTGTIGLIQVFFTGFFNAFLVMVFSVYALTNKEKLSIHSKGLLYSLIPEKAADNIMYVLKLLYKNFYNFFTGQFLEALLLGLITFVGMKILKLPYSLMISVLLGFMNIIPYFGSIIGSIIGIIIIFITSPIQALVFGVFIIIVQQFDGNYMYPKLVGKQIGVPSIWIFASITLGGAMMGVLGMIIFVPLCSTIYMLMNKYTQKKLREKNIDMSNK